MNFSVTHAQVSQVYGPTNVARPRHGDGLGTDKVPDAAEHGIW